MLHVISSLKHLQWTPLSPPPTPLRNQLFQPFFPLGWFTKHTSEQRSSGPKRARVWRCSELTHVGERAGGSVKNPAGGWVEGRRNGRADGRVSHANLPPPWVGTSPRIWSAGEARGSEGAGYARTDGVWGVWGEGWWSRAAEASHTVDPGAH